jgi:uncharacterized membrane protein
MTDKKYKHFRAVLTPNQSLSPKGFAILMGLVAGISFSAGILFVTLGAWPVFGFFGLDVAFLYWAFKRNYSDATRRELIEVTKHEIVLTRYIPKHAKRQYRFNKRWVRLELAEDSARELVGALTLYSHGKAIEIGAFLGPDERKEFYQVLKRVLVV